MKKKVLKIIAFIIAIALILGICWVANGLNGNPISKMLAKKAANEYLEANFPDTDYYIEELGFSFKFTNYYAHVRSKTSMDTQFTLYIDMVGNDMDMGQGMCGSSSGSVPTNVGQPLIRVSSITVGGR